MKVKLDENLGERGEQLLRQHGWDVSTVVSQGLCASSDEGLIEICRGEGRVLISLDKDFSNVLRFPPAHYLGIVVLRLSEPLVHGQVLSALGRFVEASADRTLTGRLWIIDDYRIREFDPTDSDLLPNDRI